MSVSENSSAPKWGRKQNDASDRRTNFIYECSTREELLSHRGEVTDEEWKYAVNRWLRYKNAERVEGAICEAAPGRIRPIERDSAGKENSNQYYGKFPGEEFTDLTPKTGRPRHYFPHDIIISYPDGGKKYFDIKCTTIGSGQDFNGIKPRIISEYKKTGTIPPALTQELINLNYENQSTEQRYSNGPRMFIFYVSLRREDENEMKESEIIPHSFARWLVNETPILENRNFSKRSWSLDKLNAELRRRGLPENKFTAVTVAAYYIIENPDGKIVFIDGNGS